MARSTAYNSKKKHGILKLKIAIEKLQKMRLLLGKKPSYDIEYDSEIDDVEDVNVPEDVKEGHFAVIAMEEGKRRRFVVPLSYLTHPTFSGLLEQAAEEYGFEHKGALTIPCRPTELERILAEQFEYERNVGW